MRVVYASEYQRIIPACIIDSRAFIPEVLNQVGTVIESFTDAEVAKVVEGVLPYKLETMEGNMIGFFSLKLDGSTVGIYQRFIRPAFRRFDLEISQRIAIFIHQNEYVADTI